MGVNTMSALSVFEAARKLAIRRVVYACSESATGFGIHRAQRLLGWTPQDHLEDVERREL